ncbi:MAG: BsuBI/PstI family type II restriction endonuclease [Gammaproteobacteria bacterium]
MSLAAAEVQRIAVSQSIDRARRSELGQFFTPSSVAKFMASLLDFRGGEARLLDPGAGIGSLTAAAIEQAGSAKLAVTCYEIEPQFQKALRSILAHFPSVPSVVESRDFIERAVVLAAGGKSPDYTHVIANPPYKKINTGSAHRSLVARLGLETSNLYACFVACAVALCKPGAQVVAIIPRSFMNGLYFKPFRYWLLDRVAITNIHVFVSRDKAFSDDAVLQENVILKLIVGAGQKKVTVSSSHGPLFEKVERRTIPFAEVVTPGDAERFIHIAATRQPKDAVLSGKPLREIGLDVCTGPVVDFRLREHLRMQPAADTVPLIYAVHFLRGELEWPAESRKPNAIALNPQTKAWLMPSEGFYVVTRRFTSKEEHRRVQAFLVDTKSLPGEWVGFENHLNVFHCNKRGLPERSARGLVTYLNSDRVDDYFRTFSGHTQVNATDLRRLNYPSLEELAETSMSRLTEALSVLVDVGMPRAQQNERSALCLLAITNMTRNRRWSEAEAPLIGITPIMEFAREHYGKKYKPNTRESIRRQTMHQFCDGGLAIYNPDKPDRKVNSPQAVYQVSPEMLSLLRVFGTPRYRDQLRTFMQQRETLAAKYGKARDMQRVPLAIATGETIRLSPGDHSLLIRQVVEVFGPIHAPGGKLIYAGDTEDKWGYFDRDALNALGVTVDNHGKMPDVVMHHGAKNWLLLIEAVTSHGPVDGKRYGELNKLFGASSAGLVFVTAFPTRALMAKYLGSIAWETKVWCSEAPTHLIHFD